MKTIILDENLPVPLRHLLSESSVVTVQYLGWSGIQNGELIDLIDREFVVLLTGDKNLRYQQRLEGRKICIIELPFTRLGSLVSPITSKCTTCDHFKVHHFGWVFSDGWSGCLARSEWVLW